MVSRRSPSLLIVDDDAPIRKLLERVALRAGFDVDTASDGMEALEKLQQKQYAIAIIDLMMPRLSGYDLVQKISELDPRPVIIVATAMADTDVAKIDDTLVRRVIRKPFDVKAVAEALVETASHIAEKQAAAEKSYPVAPPESVVIRVSPKGKVSVPEPLPPVEKPEPEPEGDDDTPSPKPPVN